MNTFSYLRKNYLFMGYILVALFLFVQCGPSGEKGGEGTQAVTTPTQQPPPQAPIVTPPTTQPLPPTTTAPTTPTPPPASTPIGNVPLTPLPTTMCTTLNGSQVDVATLKPLTFPPEVFSFVTSHTAGPNDSWSLFHTNNYSSTFNGEKFMVNVYTGHKNTCELTVTFQVSAYVANCNDPKQGQIYQSVSQKIKAIYSQKQQPAQSTFCGYYTEGPCYAFWNDSTIPKDPNAMPSLEVILSGAPIGLVCIFSILEDGNPAHNNSAGTFWNVK